jgi:transposase-like protein
VELLKVSLIDQEVLVSHANAALTPRHRLKVAQLVVDQGYPISEVAARFQVSWPTVKRWADRYAAGEAMSDRSSRPHRQPARTPPPVVRRVLELRWRKRLGPLQLASHRCRGLDGPQDPDPEPDQPPQLCRPGHRGTGPALRA